MKGFKNVIKRWFKALKRGQGSKEFRSSKTGQEAIAYILVDSNKNIGPVGSPGRVKRRGKDVM